MREFKLMDGDSHVIEPPDLWQSRVPAKYKDRAPRMERFEKGHAWIIEGAVDPINFGHNVLGGTPGGLTPEGRREWVFWEDVPKGTYDPVAHLEAMDEDGVGAGVMYPTPRISSGILHTNEEPEFHLALIRAYNDWLSEWSSTNPDRLGGIAMIPTLGIEESLLEMRRVVKMPGLRGGVLLSRWPSGGFEISDADEPFFAEASDVGIPVNIHVSFSTAAPGAKAKGATGDMRHLDAPMRTKQIINSGLLDRYPNLKMVWAETDCGWVPYVKEQMDDRFRRLEQESRPPIKNPPSYYFDKNLFFTFITDSYGVANRHWIGLSQMLWSSDYAHTGTDWPRSWNTIERHFEGVPPDEKKTILADNFIRVYGFPQAN